MSIIYKIFMFNNYQSRLIIHVKFSGFIKILSFFTRLQRLVSARSVYLEDSIFQRTVPLYATESFIKRVLKRGTTGFVQIMENLESHGI